MRRVQALVGIILLLAGLFGGSHQGIMNMGPYDIVIERSVYCSDASMNKIGLVLQPSMKKINGVNKVLYSGSFNNSFNKEEFEALHMHVYFYQRKSNNYLFMYEYDELICNVFDIMAKSFYTDFRKHIGVMPEGCDFPPGNYSFTNWEIKVNLPFPMLEYMTYKAIVQLRQEKEVVACFESIATVKRKY